MKSRSDLCCHSTRYSVIVAPLLTGASQLTIALCGDRHITIGALGGSGTPAPLTTSKGSDHGPP